MPTAKVVFIDALGFGHANVVVAVPQAWIDVHSMADLDDVATAFRLEHERKMRVATKYVNLTRNFFSTHGVTDYRIVESAGATEAAPAAGTAELIVDITTTGADARRQRAEGGRGRRDPALAGQSGGGAHGRNGARASATCARIVLDRIAARMRARAFREVRTRFAGCDEALLAQAKQRFGVEAPLGGPTSSGMLTLHCPPERCMRWPRFCARRAPRTSWSRTSATCSPAPIRSTRSSKQDLHQANKVARSAHDASGLASLWIGS